LSRYRPLAAAVAALLAVSILPLVSASAREQSAAGSDIREIADLGDGKLLPVDVDRGDVTAARRTNASTPGAYEVGSKKRWLASDDFLGIYLKNYKLRGVGKHIEVWVATGEDYLCDGDPSTTEDCPRGNEDETVNGTHFPDGDCRNDRVAVTTEQVDYLIDEFDGNIYPKESRRFSVPPNKNGKNAPLTEIAGLPANYYKGEGDNIVVLVDNVRDDHFYDFNNSEQNPYIAGFFSSTFNFYLKRNVMTIDAFDWLHRTGSNPPNNPVPGDGCLNASARPHLYEGVFAHEYQHLLESYEDPDEGLWTNEGLSDYAGRITGYFDTKKPITEIGFESHVQCFYGNTGTQTDANPLPSDGGPSNSLNLWGDQGGDDILCDYGAAATFVEWLNDTYGKDFTTRLHRLNKNGFKGLEANLAEEGTSDDALDSVHKWLASMALDGVLDDGAALTGGDAATYRVKALDALINWNAVKAYMNNPEGPQTNEGAPPNGGDFVRLRAANGDFLTAADLKSLEFQGSTTLPELPLTWTVDQEPPGHAGDPALYSNKGDNLDNAAVHEVAVPSTNATLTFENLYSMEEGYDYGYVQISEDGGETWDTLSNNHTVNEGGFNGNSGCEIGTQATCDPTWVNESFDLSDYAGKTVLVSFRYWTDAGVVEDGWWIDDVMVGDTTLTDGTTVDGWQSPTQANPVEVAGYTLQLVAYTDDHTKAWVAQVPINATNMSATLDTAALEAALGTEAQTVAAIVTYDEPTEQVNQYAPYTLTVNNKEQAGGS
jgi:hypothetical protein